MNSTRPPTGKSFNLVNYFSYSSLIILIVFGLLVGFTQKYFAIRNLCKIANENNIILTQIYANTLLSEHQTFLKETEEMSREEMVQHPQMRMLQERFLSQNAHTNVTKINIYSLDERIIFSSDQNQIGRREQNNPSLSQALNGQIATQLFVPVLPYIFQPAPEQRDILITYIPYQIEPNATIAGVLEIHTDLSVMVNHIQTTQLRIGFSYILLMFMLYLLLVVVVKRAEDVIEIQTGLLTQKTLRLENLLHKREKMLKIVGHDVKNPLTGIRLAIDYLTQQHKNLPDDLVTQKLGRLKYSLDNTIETVSHLLEIGTDAQFEISPRLQKVSLDQIIQNTYIDFEEEAKRKGITLQLDLPDEEISVLADPILLKNALANLLSNALKYSHDATTTIIKTSLHENHAEIAIIDQGLGLSDVDKKLIFSEYTRLSAEPTGNETSHGLGLYITKMMIEAMNGSIQVKSAGKNRGSTFVLSMILA